MHAITTAPARRPLLLASLLVALGLLWTMFIVLAPGVRFTIDLPRARPIIETGTMVVALATAAVAFVRYTVTGPASWLFVGLSFLVLATNHLVFGVLLTPDTLRPAMAFYVWTTARLLVAVLLLLGSSTRARTTARPGRPRNIAVAALPPLAVLVTIDVLLWLGRRGLPALSSSGLMPEDVTGPLPGLSPIVIGLGAVGSAMFLAAAISYLRPVEGEILSPWLPPALVLGALSHVHYTLLPTAFSETISTGDVLRLGFSVVVLAGIIQDTRTAYAREHARSVELARAYLAERARVEDMESLERAKEEFFTILTHELMNPVASLRGFAVTLDTRWKNMDEATKREFVGRMVAETGMLRDLAEKSVTAMQMEDPSFAVLGRPEPVVELIREVGEIHADLGDRLTIRLEDGAEEADVTADRTRFLQVVRNLLSNAVKYGDPDAPIQLWVAVEGSEVAFTVRNRGRGIPPEAVPRLFRRFSRIHTPGTEEIPGSGLGLYISMRIVEEHGGRIWLEDGAGPGTAITFTLPRVSP